MTGGCNGICNRFEYKRKLGVSPYESGKRRCQICEIFLDQLDGLRCPCCHFLTRGSSHHPNVKSRILRQKRIVYPEAVKYDVPTLQLNENIRA